MARCPKGTIKKCDCVTRPKLAAAKRKGTKRKVVDKSKIGKGIKPKAKTAQATRAVAPRRVAPMRATKSVVTAQSARAQATRAVAPRRVAPMRAIKSVVTAQSAKAPIRELAPIPKMSQAMRKKTVNALVKKMNTALNTGDIDEFMRLQSMINKMK